MAKYVIERRDGRYFIKKTISPKEKGKDITDAVGYLYTRYRQLHDGQRVSIWSNSSKPSKYPLEAIREVRGLAERMRDVIMEETGTDCLDGGMTSRSSLHRAMIAYRLHLLGYTWAIASSAVDRTPPSCQRVDPRRFISDNEDSLWNRILKVR